jgi:hypothetical protein
MGVARGVGAATSDGRAEEAFAAARALLEQAEADAQRARADADRYVQQREQEAALLVAKARRVLEAAEEKAAVIVAAARAGGVEAGSDRGAAIDLRETGSAEPEFGRVIAPGATRLTRGAHPSRLDTLLASAIESAVDDTFAGRASA